MRISPEQGLGFANMLVQDDEPLADLNSVSIKRRHAFHLDRILVFFSDCRHFRGVQSRSAVHVVLAGRAEEQQAHRGSPADASIGNELDARASSC